MDHVVSVTLIPVNGINVKLEKDIFLGNFIDKAEDVLDELPVGSAIEILYDHVVTHSDGSFQKAIPMRCFVKQTGRGVFHKDIENAPLVTDMKSVNTRRAELRRLKRVFQNKVVH